MARVDDLVTRLRAEADRVKTLDAALSPLLTDAAAALEYQQRLNSDRRNQITHLKLENDVLRMEKKR